MGNSVKQWDELGSRDQPSWYLDPLVAAQKKQLNARLIRRWLPERISGPLLKTDLFEEAHGTDQILFDLFSEPPQTIGTDISHATAHQAARLCPRGDFAFIAADVRRLPLRDGSCGAIISTSTLDHFDTAGEYRASVSELSRVLRPGGVLVITMDNPGNPLYGVLRWMSHKGWAPFLLGYTPSLNHLCESLTDAGLSVTGTGRMIYNPRGLSTVLFLGLRKVLGKHADGPIRLLLSLFAATGKLPARRWTACFNAARAVKPSNQ